MKSASDKFQAREKASEVKKKRCQKTKETKRKSFYLSRQSKLLTPPACSQLKFFE